MSKAQEFAKNIVLVILWVIAVGTVIMLLFGCEAMQKRDKREGRFTVNADCDENEIEVEFKLDQHAEDQQIEVKR